MDTPTDCYLVFQQLSKEKCYFSLLPEPYNYNDSTATWTLWFSSRLIYLYLKRKRRLYWRFSFIVNSIRTGCTFSAPYGLHYKPDCYCPPCFLIETYQSVCNLLPLHFCSPYTTYSCRCSQPDSRFLVSPLFSEVPLHKSSKLWDRM